MNHAKGNTEIHSFQAIALVLDVLALFAEPVVIHYPWRPRLRDPADEMVLEVAVNGRADAIVTFNRADFGAAPLGFGIAVASPSDVLQRG